MRRFFADEISGGEAHITGQEAHHALRVIRLSPGDRFIALGNGTEYICEAKSCADGRLVGSIIEERPCAGDPKREITLYISYMKADKMEFCAQKATELGVSRFCPFISENSVKRPKDAVKAKTRLERICEGAVKQCGRSVPPRIDDIMTFEGLIDRIPAHSRTVFAYERSEGSLKDALSGADGDIGLIVGCEGGFSDYEAEKILEAGARDVSLGSRIPRAETAAVALMAIAAYEIGC